jgi:putative transposase
LFGFSRIKPRDILMAGNAYSEIHIHMVWHTKNSIPLLTPQVEAETHHYIRGRIINTSGVFCHEVNGTQNHVHVVMTIAPTILLSEFIGALKGSSAHEVNHKLGAGRKLLEWQAGYGMVSFGTKDLEWVKAFVRHQKEHHAQGNVYDRLERITALDGVAKAEQREAP